MNEDEDGERRERAKEKVKTGGGTPKEQLTHRENENKSIPHLISNEIFWLSFKRQKRRK